MSNNTAMKAMRDLPMFYSEARRIMDERDLPDEAFESVHGFLVHRAFMEEIEPLMKHITSIYALAMPTYIRHADGSLETNGDGLTDELRELVIECRAHIEQIRFKYYGTNAPR